MAGTELDFPTLDALIEKFAKEEQEADIQIRMAYSKKHAAAEMLKQLSKLKNDISYLQNRFDAGKQVTTA